MNGSVHESEVKVVEDADYVCAIAALAEEASEWLGSTRPQPRLFLSLPLLLTHSLSLSDYWALEVRATEMKAQFIVGAFKLLYSTPRVVLHFVLDFYSLH